MPKEKRFRRAIKLYEVAEVQSMTNLFNRNRCFESGDSPLTLAAQQGHEVIVQSLLHAGADVNKLDGNGRAAIHVACQLNDLPTLKVKSPLSRKRHEFTNIQNIEEWCSWNDATSSSNFSLSGLRCCWSDGVELST